MNPDLERPPLHAAALQREIVTAGGLWTALTVVAETGSTNADTIAAARDGAAEGLVVVAEHQRAGRGRAGRDWFSPPRAGLTMSLLLRPGVTIGRWPVVPALRWGWLPLLVGVAIAGSVNRVTGVDTALKWPNDLLVDGRKCAGVLAEVAGDAVVVGIGLNVTLQPGELPEPVPGSLPVTSLAQAGAHTTDREVLLSALLDEVARWYGAWRTHAGNADACGLRAAYLRNCATIGQAVRASLPGGTVLTGTAETVDVDGHLVLRTAGGTRTLAAGDITHVRPAARRGSRGGGQALR